MNNFLSITTSPSDRAILPRTRIVLDVYAITLLLLLAFTGHAKVPQSVAFFLILTA